MAEGNGAERTDGEVLANEGVVVRLAGMEFLCPEPPRRRSRGLVVEMLDIFTRYPGLDKLDLANIETEIGTNPALGKMLLKALDEFLDFIYMAIPEAGKARKIIDDNADEEEIGTAFGAVAEVIMRPFGNAPEPEK